MGRSPQCEWLTGESPPTTNLASSRVSAIIFGSTPLDCALCWWSLSWSGAHKAQVPRRACLVRWCKPLEPVGAGLHLLHDKRPPPDYPSETKISTYIKYMSFIILARRCTFQSCPVKDDRPDHVPGSYKPDWFIERRLHSAIPPDWHSKFGRLPSRRSGVGLKEYTRIRRRILQQMAPVLWWHRSCYTHTRHRTRPSALRARKVNPGAAEPAPSKYRKRPKNCFLVAY